VDSIPKKCVIAPLPFPMWDADFTIRSVLFFSFSPSGKLLRREIRDMDRKKHAAGGTTAKL
jgi:hypothetical protein